MQRRPTTTAEPSQAELAASAELRGSLDRVVFHNAVNGYSVLRIKLPGKEYLETAVGHMPDPQPGVGLCLKGRWVINARFGRQFQFDAFQSLLPATVEGIRHYLGSGLIKGIRLRLASRIVKQFGEDTFRILDEDPDRLGEVKGLSAKTLENIKRAWAEHQGIRDLIMFLQPNGVSTTYAVRIYRHYAHQGEDALAIVRKNPYRLAMDIHGIGFITADAMAMKLGFAKDSPIRAEAGVLYALGQFSDEGHVYYPLEKLLDHSSSSLEAERALIEEAVRSLAREERLVTETLYDTDGAEHEAVYLARYYRCETGIAHYMRRIMASPKSSHFADPEQTLAEFLPKLSMDLAPEQVEAARMSMTKKIMVITGGPGTGKTTVINAVIKAFGARKAKILLAAPTGRAAKRLSETSGLDGRTIHRLLEYNLNEDAFARNEDVPLACDLLVVDEASMMDTLLMYHLVKAIPLGATVIFVGDVNQLPSVGPGNVLRDIIASRTVPVVELTEIFRQAAESEIISNAHKINSGDMPRLQHPSGGLSDFYFIRQEDPEKVADLIVELVRDHIPRRFGLDPVNDIQVLTPMHKGSAGAVLLNQRLQEALNSRAVKIQRGERQYRLDDKVMQIRNNYEKDVFNGDIGRICHIDAVERELSVRFDGTNALYSFEELDELVPAYAISVHKSQGSEYPAVVLPILTQHYVLLQRNLLYTGVTRGKRLVVLVGSPKAVAIAVANNRMHKRHTWLARRLAKGMA